MNTILQTLIKLQEVDSVIFDLQQKIAEVPNMMQRLDKQLADHETTLQETQARLEEQEKIRRTKELDVESRDVQIKKYQTQLLEVKTNKEYTALLTEIRGLKNKNSLAEDDILELMESLERGKKAIVEAKQSLEEEKTKITQLKLAKEVEQAAFQKTLTAEQQKRDQLAETIEEKFLKEYVKLLQLRNGLAVTAVQDEGICAGCYVALTPQMFAEVKTGEHLHHCPVCFRFLYWEDQL